MWWKAARQKLYLKIRHKHAGFFCIEFGNQTPQYFVGCGIFMMIVVLR